MPCTVFLKAEGTNVVPTGRRTYPRYFKLEFAFYRAGYQARPRTIDPAKRELQIRVVELRSQGWSFPAIANRLNMSVGTAWNMANSSKWSLSNYRIVKK